LENQPDEEIPQEKKERRHPRADEIENNLNRAYKLLDERDFDHAARIFRNIMLMDGQHYKAMTGLGRCLIEMGMTEEACGFFEKALEINPDYTQASLNLALYRKKVKLDFRAFPLSEMGLGMRNGLEVAKQR